MRPAPEPLDPPMVPFAVTGIVIWAVLGLVLLPFHGWLSRHGHLDWLWTCLAGFLLGFVGLALMIVHDRHRRDRLHDRHRRDRLSRDRTARQARRRRPSPGRG